MVQDLLPGWAGASGGFVGAMGRLRAAAAAVAASALEELAAAVGVDRSWFEQELMTGDMGAHCQVLSLPRRIVL